MKPGAGPAHGPGRARLVLGVAAGVLAVAGAITATAGPGGVSGSLHHPAGAAPEPVAVVSFVAGAPAGADAAGEPSGSIPGLGGGTESVPGTGLPPGTGGLPGSGTDPVAGGTTPLDPATPLNPASPVGVAVSRGTLSAVTLTDTRTGKAVAGERSADGHSWHTTAPLGYNGAYQLAATAMGDDRRQVTRSTPLSTLRPASLTSASVGPTFSAGVGQPVVVRFNHPVVDKAAAVKALSVTTSPSQTGGWYWISASEVHYRAQSYWAPGTTIHVTGKMFGVDLGKGAFGAADRTLTLHIHDSWVAKADGASETMQIFHNGAPVKEMPISLGSRDHPSHVGPHVISDKKPSIVMDSCSYGVCQGDPGYYKEKVDLDLRISNDGEFVHSAPWSVGQQGDSNVSHGCVNLSPENAKWFFDHFNLGDVVEITNAGGPKLPIYDTYGDWEVPWATWQSGGAT